MSTFSPLTKQQSLTAGQGVHKVSILRLPTWHRVGPWLLACVRKLTPVCGFALRKLCQLLCHLLLACCLAILVICHGVPHAQHRLFHVPGTMPRRRHRRYLIRM